jgi:hypothetical protein
MPERFHIIEATGIRVVVDLAVGHLRKVEIETNGEWLTPFYTAPWVDDPDIASDESLLPNLRFLSCDFFCSPFSATDDPAVPPHGWPANSRWEHLETIAHPKGGSIASFGLEKRIQGARLVKEITLRDRHPFVYQRHIFEGGEGATTVASHAMTKFAARGKLSFRSALARRRRSRRMTRAGAERALTPTSRVFFAVPLKDGGTTDFRPIRLLPGTRIS